MTAPASAAAARPTPRRGGIVRFLKKAAGGTLAAVLLLALIEGLLSFFVVARTIVRKTDSMFVAQGPKAIRFDAELGWTSNPGFLDANGCGPGRPVSVGDHGFRGRRPVAPTVAAGRVRMVVAGDSFTFGSGVADAETWAMGLEAREPELETVNAAVGGYGVDQAFLRYRRDLATLEHQLLLFGFITEDLRRMVVPAEWGADKPQLVVQEGKLQVTGVPTVQVTPFMRFARQAGTFAGELRLAQVMQPRPDPAREEPKLANDEALIELTKVVLRELHALAAARGAHLVVLHLPVESERGGGSIDSLAPLLAAEVKVLGGSWIDLLAEFRALDGAAHADLFLRRPAISAGHYDADGCARVSEWIHAKLRAAPEVARRLDAVR